MEVTSRMRSTGMLPKGWIREEPGYVLERARTTGMLPLGWIPPVCVPVETDEESDAWIEEWEDVGLEI